MDKSDVFSIDIESLTIDDIETIEDITGFAIDKLGDPDMPKGKMMRALAFVKARKTDPTATPESVGGLRIEITSDTVGKSEAKES
tara:strand:+ start:3440 stop:3694 length:255 start_codon:yes stop_codon:yes gene_type:complete